MKFHQAFQYVLLIAIVFSGVARAQDLCPEMTSCLNGGRLACSAVCGDSGEVHDLKCNCDCTENYYGPLCQIKRGCGEGGEGTAAPSVTTPVPIPSPTPPPPVATIPSEAGISPETIILSAGFSSGIEKVHFTTAPAYSSFLINYGSINNIDVDWTNEIVYYSYCCAGIGKISFDALSFEILYAANNGSYETRAVAVDEVNDFVFFFQMADAGGAIYQITTSGGTPTSLVSTSCKFCVNTVEVDGTQQTLYYINYYEETVYSCDYSGKCVGISSTFMFYTFSSFFDKDNQVLYWGGAAQDTRGDTPQVHKYDVMSQTYSFVGELPATGNFDYNSFDGVTVRGDTVYMKKYIGGCSTSSLYSVPVTGGTVSENAIVQMSCFGWGMD